MAKKGGDPRKVEEVLCSVVEEVMQAAGLTVVHVVGRARDGRMATRVVGRAPDGHVVVAASVVRTPTVVVGTDHAS